MEASKTTLDLPDYDRRTLNFGSWSEPAHGCTCPCGRARTHDRVLSPSHGTSLPALQIRCVAAVCLCVRALAWTSCTPGGPTERWIRASTAWTAETKDGPQMRFETHTRRHLHSPCLHKYERPLLGTIPAQRDTFVEKGPRFSRKLEKSLLQPVCYALCVSRHLNRQEIEENELLELVYCSYFSLPCDYGS